MIYTAILLLALCLTGCSLRSTYPTLGGVIGGGAASLGGPAAAALGAGAGVLAGEALKNKDALIEAEEKLDLLTHGDVSELVAKGMESHKSGFDAFTSYIKKILIGAAVLLGGYLAIPIFIAKRTARNCSKTEAEKHMTRAPFPVKPPSRNP
tara:strand:+ start:1295 stop:1750 length:456 start_codon:yes stop_codon:yes gene_type:complete